MKAEEMAKLSEKVIKEKKREVCNTEKQVFSLIKSYAKFGLNNCSVIVYASDMRNIEGVLIREGFRVYCYINEENNGQLDVEWC